MELDRLEGEAPDVDELTIAGDLREGVDLGLFDQDLLGCAEVRADQRRVVFYRYRTR